MKVIPLAAVLVLLGCKSQDKSEPAPADPPQQPATSELDSILTDAVLERLQSKWMPLQAELSKRLHRPDLPGVAYYVDLGKEKIQWLNSETRVPFLEARIKLIGSWAASNKSFLGGWANQSIEPKTAIAAPKGIPDTLAPMPAKTAYWAAALLADGAGSDYFFESPGQQLTLYYALWDLRASSPDAKPPSTGSPFAYQQTLVDNLLADEMPDERLATLLNNYANDLAEDEQYQGGPYAKVHDSFIGELRAIAKLPHKKRRPQLDRLRIKIGKWQKAMVR